MNTNSYHVHDSIYMRLIMFSMSFLCINQDTYVNGLWTNPKVFFFNQSF